MKRVLILASMAFVLAALVAPYAYAGSTRVNGYYRSDGSYVQGYYRTTPNSTRLDNYSTKGNYNPYTGKKGTKSRYSNPYKW